MNYTMFIEVAGQRVPVEVSAYEVLRIADKIEQDLMEATQNIIVVCSDGTNWCNGITTPSVGIRKTDAVGGYEAGVLTGDINWLIAGTLRRIDNDQEIVRINHLMKLGYENAYVDLRAQAMVTGTLSRPKLGKRKIINMKMVGDMTYLTLAPMDTARKPVIGFCF